ncbi:MAG TPA: hypothetical protein DIT13_16405 [Verrucomicrobiales bacterium]|nr:hypothetical protein [Verrucomicrobiales bacterium]HRJ07686.1 metallophosphoesterase [Prosthecobacter sp.]HRK15476.1 metallophosphoesterase [Prosthecobacter sp.]
MKQQSYDLIGDIHGQHEKLARLLENLGYRPRPGGGMRHPDGRRVVFLGDYIDRGPDIRRVLETVRGMVESGDALAIMGNHEYNAVLYATPDGNGGHLKEHSARNTKTHQATLDQFAGRPAEWAEWLLWMRGLPMFLDLGALRAVHACWDARRISRLGGASLLDPDFLRASATKLTPEHRAVENVLKGPEMLMPEGSCFHDKEGAARRTVRVRWWNIPPQSHVCALAMPEPFDSPGDAAPHDLRRLPCYGSNEPPVFFGHYWLPPEKEKAPLARNLACLDFSGARQGPLVAYRWDGERELSPEKFLCASLLETTTHTP